MNIHNILTSLRAERDRIERAIAAIEGLNSTTSQTAGRQPTTASSRVRRLSAAARRKLSLLMKQRWAQRKKAKAKAAASKRTRLSRAARMRIAAAQRARWAKVREQQAQKKAA